MNKKVIVIGDGCESSVCQNIIELNGDIVYKVLPSDKEIPQNIEEDCEYIIAIGNNYVRKNIVKKYKDLNLKWYTAIHPKAYIDKKAKVGEGSIIHYGAFVNCNASIGNFCILGTNSLVEHCCIIENFCNIGCGAIISGDVIVRTLCQISLGACVVNGVHINKRNLIGAGSVVPHNIIPTKGVYVGCPAKHLRENEQNEI